MIDRLVSSIGGAIRITDPVVVALVITTVTLIAPQWNRVFADRGHLVPIALATTGAALGSWLTVRLGAGRPTGLAVGAFGLLAGLAAWYGADVTQLPDELISGWKAAASTGLLMATDRSLVIVPVVIAWIGSWLATSAALRGRTTAGALVPIAAAHGVTLGYTLAQGAPRWWMAALIGSLGLVIVALGSIHGIADQDDLDTSSTAPIRWRQLALGVPVLAVAAGAGLAADRALVDRDGEAFDLRERLVRPLDIFEDATPLTRVKGGLVEPNPSTVMTIEVEGLPPDAAIRQIPIATLDLYDGSIWVSSARFEAAGASLPLPSQTGALLPDSITQRVSITSDYPFRFLPRVGTVRGTDTDGLGWDPRSGTLARADGSRTEFEFETIVELRVDELPDAIDGPNPDSVRYAARPPELDEDQRPVFSRFIDEAGAGATSEFDRLVRIQDSLRSETYGYNEAAASGHSLAALASYLSPPDGGPSVGFAEQSASVFALVARQLGHPSRVVVGYRPTEEITASNPTATITEDQIHAWPEVWVNGLGWYAFEPTNTGNETTEQSARTPAISAQGQNAQPTPLPDLQEPVLIPDPLEDGAGLGRWAAPLLVLFLPVIYLAVLTLWRFVRRFRRQRHGDPARRTIGASLETRDQLAALGLPAGDHLSLLDVADELDVIDLRDVSDPVTNLAPMVDEALFAPHQPTDDTANDAWNTAAEAMRAARSSRSLKARARAVFDPRH